MSNDDHLVRFVDIQKSYDGETLVVKNLNLDVARGEFLTMLGPSGSGKTTCLMMLAGFEPATHGEIYLKENPINRVPPHKRGIGMVFQNYALFPHMSVEQNIAFGLKMQKVPRRQIADRVAEAIKLVRLETLERRKPDQMSGGQQQRVALARALVNHPKVLLLDEPLGALDLKLRQEMQLELKHLQREVGITFVFVTHDQEEALTMSDRIGVMNHGELLQVGTPEEIYEHPVNRFVADFIGQTNLLAGTVESSDTLCLANGVRIHADSDLEVGSRAAFCLRPERASVHPQGTVDGGRESLDGRLSEVTYLGNSIIYTVALDWMSLEVRTENHPGEERPQVGDEITVSWRSGAGSVVAE